MSNIIPSDMKRSREMEPTGGPDHAFFLGSVLAGDKEGVAERITEIPGVVRCVETFGPWDLVIEAEAGELGLGEIKERIRNDEAIVGTVDLIVMPEEPAQSNIVAKAKTLLGL